MDTQTPNLIAYVNTIGAIATPILVLLLTAIGWKLKQSIERQRVIEEKLRDKRTLIYQEILDPFILLFTTDEAWKSDPNNKGKDKMLIATRKLLSLEYRKTGFNLSLVAPDPVVFAFNDLMQLSFTYDENTNDEQKALDRMKETMRLLGNFLLEIRKSMGNENTKIANWEMLEWFIIDARTYKNS